MSIQTSTSPLGIGFAPAWHRPFLRYVEGEQGGGPAPAEPTPAAPAEPESPTPAEAPAEPQEGAEEPNPDGGENETFSRAYVEKLRRENASAREKAKTDAAAAAEAAKNELAQSIGKALGLVKDDEQVDPAALLTQAQADREAALKEARDTKVQLAVIRTADKHGANTDELLDTASFLKKLSDLDPAADDFASQVDALVKQQVDSNPARFKRVQVAASSGSATHTGETAPVPTEAKSIDDLRKERQKRRGITL